MSRRLVQINAIFEDLTALENGLRQKLKKWGSGVVMFAFHRSNDLKFLRGIAMWNLAEEDFQELGNTHQLTVERDAKVLNLLDLKDEVDDIKKVFYVSSDARDPLVVVNTDMVYLSSDPCEGDDAFYRCGECKKPPPKGALQCLAVCSETRKQCLRALRNTSSTLCTEHERLIHHNRDLRSRSESQSIFDKSNGLTRLFRVNQKKTTFRGSRQPRPPFSQIQSNNGNLANVPTSSTDRLFEVSKVKDNSKESVGESLSARSRNPNPEKKDKDREGKRYMDITNGRWRGRDRGPNEEGDEMLLLEAQVSKHDFSRSKDFGDDDDDI
jgi:hypothetical protein